MNLDPYYEKCIYARTLDHEAEFAAMTEHLPERDEMTPYHSEAHSLRSMEMAYQLADHPMHILEVGFCLGHSASVWFGLGAETVTSIELSSRPQTLQAGRIMWSKYGQHFHLLLTTSDKVGSMPQQFDLMFIDGGHEFQDVSNDIKLGLHLKIPYLLFDDWFPKWGPGVQPAIEHHQLIPLAILGNMALCVPPDGWKDSK